MSSAVAAAAAGASVGNSEALTLASRCLETLFSCLGWGQSFPVPKLPPPSSFDYWFLFFRLILKAI